MICEEIFDESSHPSIEEIREYANKIGIDPDSEPQLLPLAAEGLMKALPPGWRPCFDEKSKAYYYLNKSSGKTQWEHPLDEVYRGLVAKKRAESQSLSLGEPTEDATYNRDELPSFEEPPPPPPKKLEPLWLGARKKENTKKDAKLSPLKTNFDQDTTQETPKLSKQKSEERPATAKKFTLSTFNSFDDKRESNFDKHPRSMNDKNDFILTGGGSMFLKSNTKKQDSLENLSSDSASKKNLASTPDFPLQPRSILRERGSINLETSKSMEFDKTFGEKIIDDDDKKSVRFNLDSNPDFPGFDFSDKSDMDEEFKHIDDIIKANLGQNTKGKRFITSPVKDFLKQDSKSDLTKQEQTEYNANLKLIKPNPTDFLKPKLNNSKISLTSLNLSGAIHSSDSEDDSMLKNLEDKNYTALKEIERKADFDKKDLREKKSSNELRDLTQLDRKDLNDLNELRDLNDRKDLLDQKNVSKDSEKKDFESEKKDRMSMLKSKFEKQSSSENFKDSPLKLSKQTEEEIKDQAEKQFEAFRTSIWEQKSKELDEFKEKVHESHKKEMERILITEKTKFEESIKEELENLRTEMENRSSGALKEEEMRLEEELESTKETLEEKIKIQEVKYEDTLKSKLEGRKKELDEELNAKAAELEQQLTQKFEARKQELVSSHNAAVEQLKENHSVIIEDLKREFKAEEQTLRKEHQNQLLELKNKIKNAADEGNVNEEDQQAFEKVRCEKRLLEDKYRCLKEKYLRLKNDVKLSIEKRNKKREQSVTTTTGSETELSHSMKKERSPGHSPSVHRKHNADKPPTPKHVPNRNDLNNGKAKAARQILIQDFDTSASDRSYKGDEKFAKEKIHLDYDSSDGNVNPGRSKKKLFSRLKSSSTSRINNGSKSRKSQRSCSPVENLRRQLQKLEDLEDQFPDNQQADTYHLRYPFAEPPKVEGSSELEFFRHRIHLERDSIKRAKESLRTQKCLFQQRQKELKLKHGSMARHTFQQLCQEEKELTDMEVSLHRTRSLLGEKVIRLRHLEQSLQRAAFTTDQNKQEDATLSDISSHSASSGISSTEFATADGVGKTFIRGEHLQESSEIIQSLENLNSEIREIWEVLHKQQQQQGSVPTVMPPLPLIYPDLGWPILAGTAPVPAPPSIPTLADRLQNYRQHVALANAQSTVVTHATQGATTTLVERTRNLRHWLRQAGIDPSNDGNTPQATL